MLTPIAGRLFRIPNKALPLIEEDDIDLNKCIYVVYARVKQYS